MAITTPVLLLCWPKLAAWHAQSDLNTGPVYQNVDGPGAYTLHAIQFHPENVHCADWSKTDCRKYWVFARGASMLATRFASLCKIDKVPGKMPGKE